MKRNKKKYEFYHPHGWQLDPTALCTQSSEVQYWRNGLMAGVIAKSKAMEYIADGVAFVMSEQAVGAMSNGVSLA